MLRPKLGIDIGGVIISSKSGDTTFFSDNYLSTPEVPGAIDVITELNKAFQGNTCIISKAGDRGQQKSRHWLDSRNFWSRTGILPNNLFFCYERPGKAPIAREQEVTHFVDDTAEVHAILENIVARRYMLLGRPSEIAVYRNSLTDVFFADTWEETGKAILQTL